MKVGSPRFLRRNQAAIGGEHGRPPGLIRHPGSGQPRCNGEVAMADAVITLVSNMALQAKRRIELRPEWFDPNSDAAAGAKLEVERGRNGFDGIES